MKKLFLFFVFSLISINIFAKEKPIIKDTYEYDLIATSIKGVSEPQIVGDYIVFTAEHTSRTVGIAFDFENFSKIHSYKIRKTYDIEGKETSSWFFYVLEKPKKLKSLSYRIVLDGLWTTDPTNKQSIYDIENGIKLSYLEIPQTEEMITESLPEGYTKFVYFSEPGQKIRLGGSFTNWDSWIYELTETEPGKYQIYLPLPAGTHYYAYYIGMQSFIDLTNPHKGYSPDGKTVSCLIIK